MSIYDAGGQRAMGIVQQVQMPFAGKIATDAPQHRFRVLADRVSGRVTLLVDGVVLGQFGPKNNSTPRNLGRGLGVLTQPAGNQSATFANLWIAPWNGHEPGASADPAAPQDLVLLANGDEVPGKVIGGAADNLRIDGEIGALDIPVSRLTAIDFNARPTQPVPGVRIRLNDRSVFTVSSFRVENGSVVCRNDMLGELKFPVSTLQEVSLSPVYSVISPAHAKSEDAPAPKASPAAGILFNRAVIDEEFANPKKR
jgi:hypothetical protein